MTTIPTTNISFSSIYNACNDPDHNGSAAISLSSFRGQTFADGSSVPSSGEISINDDLKGKDSNTGGGGGGPDYPPDIITLNPFDEVRLSDETHRNNYKIDWAQNAPIYFMDQGGSSKDYDGDSNFYLTFWSPYGLRFWINSGSQNYYEFEKMTYSQYDRLGMQVSNNGEKELGNFQSGPEWTNGQNGIITERWLQTSGQPNPPWDRSFGNGNYRTSTNGYIFPADTSRGEELGHFEGRAMDILFTTIRFYFSSDRYSNERGWFFSVYPLAQGSEGDPIKKEIPPPK